MTVSQERLEVIPFTRPEMSETTNQCFFSSHPNGSGVCHPKRLPPARKGKLNRPTFPWTGGDRLADAPGCPVNTAVAR